MSEIFNNEPYCDVEYYLDTYAGTIMDDEEEIERKLRESSDMIDILTFRRIRLHGFENCSEFEKYIIRTVCCEISDFYKENGEDLNTILNKYSINGVSMEFGKSNANIVSLNGITILRSTYQKLSQIRFACLSTYY